MGMSGNLLFLLSLIAICVSSLICFALIEIKEETRQREKAIEKIVYERRKIAFLKELYAETETPAAM